MQTSHQMAGAQFWDTWWNERLSKGYAATNKFPMLEAPTVKHGVAYVDVVNSDKLLRAIMGE